MLTGTPAASLPRSVSAHSAHLAAHGHHDGLAITSLDVRRSRFRPVHGRPLLSSEALRQMRSRPRFGPSPFIASSQELLDELLAVDDLDVLPAESPQRR